MLDIIRLNPEHHEQSSWASYCGTTRCVAGWVAFLHPELFESWAHHGCAYEITGMHGLDIGWAEARNVFHATNEKAVYALEYLAKGEPIDWEAVRNS